VLYGIFHFHIRFDFACWHQLLLAILKQLIKPIEFASMALRSYEETSARPAISFS
jgi:hypothetical protein